MTLPAGTISMSQVAAELGISQNGLSLDHSWIRQLANAGASPAVISMNTLQGQTAQPNWNGTPSTGGIGTTMNVSVPFFRGTTATVGSDNQTPINNLFVTFSAAPNWTGRILLKNNSTGATATLTKQDSLTWELVNGGNGPLRPGVTDNYSLFPSN